MEGVNHVHKGALGHDLSKYQLTEPTGHERKGHGCKCYRNVISKSSLHVKQVSLSTAHGYSD